MNKIEMRKIVLGYAASTELPFSPKRIANETFNRNDHPLRNMIEDVCKELGRKGNLVYCGKGLYAIAEGSRKIGPASIDAYNYARRNHDFVKGKPICK